MTGHDLTTAREQLVQAVAQFDPPPFYPLNISPWVGMALLQKAVRRGRKQCALRAAATLLHQSPERLWRRIGCIAYEDVGVGDLDTVAMVTGALAGKRLRVSLSRSSSAPVSRSELNTLVHSSNGRFEVTMVEPRSYR